MLREIVAPVVVLAAFVFAAQAPQAEALSCLPAEPVGTFLAEGGTVFVGTATSNVSVGTVFQHGQSVDKRKVTFNVERAWGNTRISTPFSVIDRVPPISNPGSPLSDPWGFSSTFEVGKRYIVYASLEEGEHRADIGGCSRSGVWHADTITRFTSELGEGYVPDQTITNPPRDSFQDALLKQIQELLAMVADLQKRLANLGGGAVVTDFTSCIAAGNPVLESYPRQCAHNGQTFSEVIKNPRRICPIFLRNLWLGIRGDDVSELQEYLRDAGAYTYPEITGYFGPATQAAVERWQAQHGVVSSGSAATTGYGVVGPATRAAIKRICGGVSPIYPPIQCTQEAKICPDGSSVGRTGPNCEFAACPGEPVACTLEYAPVCGQPNISCPAGADCQRPLPKTYGNSCQMRADGATFLYNGACRDKDPVTPPNSCKVWNDGCNSCVRDYPGGPMSCTERACIWQGVPKCEKYFDDVPRGGEPIIHAFTGPTVLGKGEKGVWEIKASDPQNGSLSYQIDWGEKRYEGAFDAIAALAGSGFVQNTTFTHSYAFAGTYTITITVRDQQGLTAKTTTTVKVGGEEAKEGFSVVPTSGKAPLTVTATITLPPRSGFDLVEVCGPIVVGDINWGDGTTSRPTRLGCSSQRVVTVTHTYQSNGTYSVVFERTDNTRFLETVRVGGTTSNDNFWASPTSGNAPLTVTFYNNVNTGHMQGPIRIDYGDGTTGSPNQCYAPLDVCQSPSKTTHTYSSPGTYTARLLQGNPCVPTADTVCAAWVDRELGSATVIVGGGSGGIGCFSGGQVFNEGYQTSCIDPDNDGTQTCIVDATYVCRNGEWATIGSYWGPTCQGGSTYGAGYYEQCEGARDTLSVFEPSGGFYNKGDDIRVSWSTNVQNANAGMYLVLEDEASGKRFKSMKVERGLGQAIINTGSHCNFFFSDGIDGDCNGLRENSLKGNVRYRIKAVIYTPANACFGFCAPGSPTVQSTVIESYSVPFTLSI